MKDEKITECISMIDEKYINEAVMLSVGSTAKGKEVSSNKRIITAKKPKAVVIICAAALITAVSALIVTAASVSRSISGPPSMEDAQVSGYVNSYVPTERDYIRTDIYDEFNARKEKLRQEMTAKGKDAKDAAFEAENQVENERIYETVDILKKYNILNSDFFINNAEDIKKVMRSACELINSSENIATRDEVFLEMFLIYNYYSYPVQNDEDLKELIDNTVTPGYRINTYYRRDQDQTAGSQEEESN